VGAFAGKRERNGLADAPARSGHHGDFVAKTFRFHNLCLVFNLNLKIISRL
jgi:hypothetical protein